MRRTLWILALALCMPSIGWGRGLQTQTVTRTAFFPEGPGWVVSVSRHQGSGVYPGARRTRTTVVNKKMDAAALKALREKHRLPEGKFAVHQSYTVSSVRLFPF